MNFAALYDDILFLIFDELILSFEKEIIKILELNIQQFVEGDRDSIDELIKKIIHNEIYETRTDGFILSCRNNYQVYQKYKLRPRYNNKIFKYFSNKNITEIFNTKDNRYEISVFIIEIPAAITFSKKYKELLNYDKIIIVKEEQFYGSDDINLIYKANSCDLRQKLIERKYKNNKYKNLFILLSSKFEKNITYNELYDYTKEINFNEEKLWSYISESGYLPIFTVNIKNENMSIKYNYKMSIILDFVKKYELMRPEKYDLIMKFLEKELKNHYDFFKRMEIFYKKIQIIIDKYGRNEYVKEEEFNEEFNKKI